MKIVNIMIARGLGGIEQAFLDYNNALLSQGFDVLAITDKRAQINEKNYTASKFETMQNPLFTPQLVFDLDILPLF